MNVNVRAAQAKQTQKVIDRQEDESLQFALSLGLEYCRGARGFGKKRLNRMLRGMYGVLTDLFDHYNGGEDEIICPETVPTLSIGLRNRVTALEVDTDGIEKTFAFHAPPKPRWCPPVEREKRQARYEQIQRREGVYKAFWYAQMIYLWQTYGWGKTRLTRFYWHCRERYAEVCAEYLKCRTEADTALVRNQTETIVRMTDLGVKF